MAAEASVAEQTTDAIGEKEVVDDVKIVEENASQTKETGESEGVEKPKLEEQARSELVQTDSRESTEDRKDEEPAAEAGKKEDEVSERPVSAVLEEEKDVAPAEELDEVKKENEEAKASSSEVEGNKEQAAVVAQVVKEETEIYKTPATEEPKVEGTEKEPKESTEDKKDEESVPEAGSKEDEIPEAHVSEALEGEKDAAPTVGEVKNQSEEALEKVSSAEVVENEKEHTVAVVEVVQEDTETGKASNPNEPETKAAKGEPEEKATVTIESLSEEVQEPLVESEQSSVHESDQVGQEPEVAVVPIGNVGADGHTEEIKNKECGEDASESQVKEVEIDTSIQSSSATDDKGVKDATALVTETAEVPLKPEVNVEEHMEEKTVVPESVEECKEVETPEKEPVDEQKEEKAVTIEPNITAAEGTSDVSGPDQPIKDFNGKDESWDSSEKAVEENKDIGGSESATKVTEVYLETEKPSEVTEKVSEELKDEGVKDETTVVQASRDVDLGGTNVVDVSIKEPVDISDVVEQTDPGSTEKEEKEEKKHESHESEKTDSQTLAESSKDGAGSKTDVVVQKSETPAKPKTLISKVKHSIVKVKKAIIGKSPSSKTMSAESKDEPKTK